MTSILTHRNIFINKFKTLHFSPRRLRISFLTWFSEQSIAHLMWKIPLNTVKETKNNNCWHCLCQYQILLNAASCCQNTSLDVSITLSTKSTWSYRDITIATIRKKSKSFCPLFRVAPKSLTSKFKLRWIDRYDWERKTTLRNPTLREASLSPYPKQDNRSTSISTNNNAGTPIFQERTSSSTPETRNSKENFSTNVTTPSSPNSNRLPSETGSKFCSTLKRTSKRMLLLWISKSPKWPNNSIRLSRDNFKKYLPAI